MADEVQAALARLIAVRDQANKETEEHAEDLGMYWRALLAAGLPEWVAGWIVYDRAQQWLTFQLEPETVEE